MSGRTGRTCRGVGRWLCLVMWFFDMDFGASFVFYLFACNVFFRFFFGGGVAILESDGDLSGVCWVLGIWYTRGDRLGDLCSE